MSPANKFLMKKPSKKFKYTNKYETRLWKTKGAAPFKKLQKKFQPNPSDLLLSKKDYIDLD